MKTIYLHIGTFKTGTSSIQRFLSDHRESLKKQGFFVPKSILPGHHELPISLIRDLSEFNAAWPQYSGNSYKIWNALTDEIVQSDCSNIIISSEAFCDIVNENCRNSSYEMGKRIKEHFAPFRIVILCYLRDIPAYMRSMYGESVKNTNFSDSYEEQVLKYWKNRSIHMFPSIYLDFYSELFGENAIRLRKYDLKTLYRGDVVSDFLQWVGLDAVITELREDQTLRQKLNLSIVPEIIDLKRAFNLNARMDLVMNREISALLIRCHEIATNNQKCTNSTDTTKKLLEAIKQEQSSLAARSNLHFNLPSTETLKNYTENQNTEYLFLVALLARNLELNQNILERLSQQGSSQSNKRSFINQLRRIARKLIQ